MELPEFMIAAAALVLACNTRGVQPAPRQHDAQASGSAATPDADSGSAAAPPAKSALTLLLGEGVVQDRWQALSIFQRECRDGNETSCGMVVVTYGTNPIRREVAGHNLLPACKAGNLRACELARTGINPDVQYPAALWTDCNSGHAYACGELGRRRKDARMLAQACIGGDITSCKPAMMLDRTIDLTTQRQALARRGCAQGAFNYCEGNDLPRMLPLLLDQCRHGWTDACVQALLYSPRIKDATILRNACRLDPRTCESYGAYLINLGTGDLAAEREAFGAGCHPDLVFARDGRQFYDYDRTSACTWACGAGDKEACFSKVWPVPGTEATASSGLNYDD